MVAHRSTEAMIESIRPIRRWSPEYSFLKVNRSLISPAFSLMIASGLLISCATPAESRPMEAILLAYSTWCRVATRFWSAW